MDARVTDEDVNSGEVDELVQELVGGVTSSYITDVFGGRNGQKVHTVSG